MGLSAGLDFETKIFVKEDAPELLRKELASKKWVPQCVAISGVTDPYQPVERRLGLTRRCIEVFAEFRNPVGIVTKNALVERDADLLAELAAVSAAIVSVSVTTLDAELARILEPRTSAPVARLRAIKTLSQAGVPVGVLTAPVIPGLTDHETLPILQAAAAAGARYAGYTMLRLPFAVATLFENWLDQHFPVRKDKILNRIRSIRDGKLNGAEFGTRMRGTGPWAELFRKLFGVAREKAGIPAAYPRLSAAAFRNPSERTLFD
jgi:DNA repair photolyase